MTIRPTPRTQSGTTTYESKEAEGSRIPTLPRVLMRTPRATITPTTRAMARAKNDDQDAANDVADQAGDDEEPSGDEEDDDEDDPDDEDEADDEPEEAPTGRQLRRLYRHLRELTERLQSLEGTSQPSLDAFAARIERQCQRAATMPTRGDDRPGQLRQPEPAPVGHDPTTEDLRRLYLSAE